MAPARTGFLVRFTEDVFRQSTVSLTKFDQSAATLGESSVRPLRGRVAETTPKMQMLRKVAGLCTSGLRMGGTALGEGVQSEDTDVMWNEFLRFRRKIKYNLIYTLLCNCCTRK